IPCCNRKIVKRPDGGDKGEAGRAGNSDIKLFSNPLIRNAFLFDLRGGKAGRVVVESCRHQFIKRTAGNRKPSSNWHCHFSLTGPLTLYHQARSFCLIRNFLKKLIIASLVFLTLQVVLTLAAAAAGGSFMFGGVPFSPGSNVQANVPLSALEKSYAGQGGNPVPPYAVAVLATPANFDPTKSWSVLIPCSTSDFKRQNQNDLVQFYQRVALSEGWVLLAGDGPQHAKNDNVAWRESMTLAAIDALH